MEGRTKLLIAAGVVLGLLIGLPPAISIFMRESGKFHEAAPEAGGARAVPEEAEKEETSMPEAAPKSIESLEALMERVGDEFKAFNKAAGKGALGEAAPHAENIAALLPKAAGFEPPLHKERLEEFKRNAAAAGEKARGLAAAARAPGASKESILPAHTALREACEGCHGVFQPKEE
jgi:cytochrome c556